MTMKRQDSWTANDDMILAEVTLRHIREGGTQLSAFEEVGEKLGRTPAACGFRWNSSVRKKYETAIQSAKSQRQKQNRQRGKVPLFGDYTEEFNTIEDSTYSLDHVIRFLRQYKNEINHLRRLQKQLEKELEERELHTKKLERENYEMRSQLNLVQSDYHLVNDDYRTLVQIMERARKMALLNDREEINRNTKFHVEENGKLQQLEK